MRKQRGAVMYVCNCYGVNEETINTAIKDGCCNLRQIGEKTMAGTNCGKCRPQIAAMIDTHKKEKDK
mgnify:CR=1 FL=1